MSQVRRDLVYKSPDTWKPYCVDEIKSNSKYSCVAGPFGSSISAKYFTDEGIPIIRGSNLKDDLTRFVSDEFAFVSEERAKSYLPQHVRGKDLIFTCWGTIGQVGFIPEDGPFEEYIISNKQLKLRVNEEIADPLFCYYYFSSRRYVEYIRNRGIGGAVPGINLGILKSLPIALPPLKTQKRIADILSAYDDLIENNRRRIALLERAARELYREWFVRLRFPGHEHCRIVDGVPEGWERRTLIELAKIEMGQSPKSEYYNDTSDGLPFHQGVTNYGTRFVEDSIYSSAVTKIANPGDILFSVRAPVGRLNVTRNKMVLGRGLAAIRSLNETQSFLFYQLRNHFFKENLIGGGAIYAAVTKKDMESLVLLTPSDRLLSEFDSQASLTDTQILNLTMQNEKLTKARDLLLPRLMDGRIAV